MTVSFAAPSQAPQQVAPVDLSVVICTYNGSHRLGRVLDCLKLQETEGFRWEVIVVDNNSSDETSAIVESYQVAWSGDVPLRYCFEAKQGLAFARQQGVEAANGALVGFLDDDNLPEPEWVAKAYEFACCQPQVGAYGSRISGEFETCPPENFHRIAPYLALIDRGDKALYYNPKKKLLPPGAGLVVRKQAWLENVPKSCFLQGRVAGCQLPGEDLEALLHIQRAGWEIWYNPEMRLHHAIPSDRLAFSYLLRLCKQIGLSRFHTRMLSVKRWLRPLAMLAYMGNDLLKIARHLARYRVAADRDMIAACELSLYVGSLVSPLYLAGKYLKQP